MEATLAACIDVGRHYDFEEEHSRQAARLALRLFDLTTELHGLDDDARALLYYAGLLHDIGYVDGYEQHHKTAYRLIMQADLPGLSEREKHIVANVARYHRGAQPQLKHQGFAELEDDDRDLVRALGALLRLADGLDRTHTNAVRDVDVFIDSDLVVVEVDCARDDDCDAELWAGEKKGRWFGELFGRRVEVRLKD
jgi:exopolyphosphatase/guanosine-5'-triphosphate,3'-diphosphate pyrophosphatase